MKLFKYSLIAALALSGALCACDDDNDYAPGAPVAGDEVYFPITEDTTVDIPTDATSVDITVNRLRTCGPVVVNVVSTVTDSKGADASSIFTVPSEVAFKDGSETAELTVGVDFSKVVPDESYTVSLTLEGNDTTPYGPAARTYTLVYAPWTDWEYVPGEIGVYTMTVLSSIKGSYEVDVLTRKSLVNTNKVQYAVAGLFTNGIDFVYSMDLSETVNIDGEDYPAVTLETYKSPLTNGESDEHFWWMDVREWIAEFWGLGWDRVDAIMQLNNLPPSYFNTKTGLFSIDVAVVSDDPELPGTSGVYGVQYEYLQLPGYKSYNLEFEYTGNYVDPYNEIEYAIVNAYKSEDVNSYVYKLFGGQLVGDDLNAAVEDIKADEDLEAVTESTTNLAFPLKDNGVYTLVAVGRDAEGEEVCKQAYTFEYNTVQGGGGAEKWASLGYCEYTDGFVNSAYRGIGGETWDVEIQESVETPGLYRLVNPYKEWAEAYEVDYAKGNHYIVVNAQNPEHVYLDQTNIGLIVDPADGEWIVWSLGGYYLEAGNSEADIAKAGFFGTLEDGVITFPTASLLVGFEHDAKWYTANINNNNPTGGQNYGPGTFCIDMSSILSAPAKAKSISAKSKVSCEKVLEATTYSNSIKSVKIDAQTLQNYRRANSQYRY